MGLITKETIDRALHAVQIEEVVGAFVELKKAGATFKGKSPWTDEKTPSFYVVPSKGIYKCFSSGKGGGPVGFLQEMGHTFPEAIRWICDRYGITVETQADDRTEETKDKHTEAEKALASVARKYQKNGQASEVFQDFTKSRGLTDDDVLQWGLGIAPDEWQHITQPILNAGLFSVASEIGLVSTKNERNFDAYRDRIIFPIHDARGRLVGLAGRRVGDEGPKYINPRQSFYYDKSRILYGFHHARNAIAKAREVYVVEGYTDCIAMHRQGIENTVACCGTALTEQHAKALARVCDTVVLLLDGDQAGQRATAKSLPIVLSQGLNAEVCTLPEGKDPDELAGEVQGEDFRLAIETARTDGPVAYLETLKAEATGPAGVGRAAEAFVELLAVVKNPALLDVYARKASQVLGVNQKALRGMIDGKVAESKPKPKAEDALESADGLGLTSEEMDLMRDFGFVDRPEGLYFMSPSKDRGGEPLFRATNFRVDPLFHVVSDVPDDNKRLMEVSNHRKTLVLDVPSSALVSFTDFRRALISKGNFQFLPGATEYHFRMLMAKWGDEFPECEEVHTLGQQPEGFYSFANGIVERGTFKEVDDFGICEYDQEREKPNGDTETRTKRFYFPAFSSIYRDVRQDDDKYQNDRFFVFKESPVELSEWTAQLSKVYGIYGQVAAGYVFAAVFRDIFFNRYGYFPHIFAYGEKGSGKSKFCESLHSFFFLKLPPFNLNSGTEVGFASRLARVANTVNWFDEYHDQLDESRFQALKGAFDGVGREKGKKSGRNKTEITRVLSGNLISGQYISARDDNSLTTRSIVLEFSKVDRRTDEQVEAFDKLKRWEEAGLSSLVVDLLRHRGHMESRWVKTFVETRNTLKNELRDDDYVERILNNYAVPLSAMFCLSEVIKMDPAQLKAFAVWCRDEILKTSAMIAGSEGAAVFWTIVSDLIDKNHGITADVGGLRQGFDFQILYNKTSLNMKKGKETFEWQNTETRPLLLLRLNRAHGAYQKEFRQRHQTPGMNKVSVENFLRSRKYYLGTCPAYRFESMSSSAHVFDLKMLQASGVELERGEGNPGIPTPQPEPAGQPF